VSTQDCLHRMIGKRHLDAEIGRHLCPGVQIDKNGDLERHDDRLSAHRAAILILAF
jgi:hypothetical protein